MPENSFLKNERLYFADKEESRFKIARKTLNDILERYNKFLQKALLGESAFVAEDLKITMEKTGGASAKSEDSKPE